MVELADTLVSRTSGASRAGSTPAIRIPGYALATSVIVAFDLVAQLD